MSRLTIAIPTFRRPDDLKRAIGGVLKQVAEQAAREPSGGTVSDAEVLVNLNILTEDGETTRAGLYALGRYPQRQFPGLSITAAVTDTNDTVRATDRLTIACPLPQMLAALVGLQASTGCQAVAGPVIPVYEVEPEEWVRQGEFFVRKTWPTGTVRPVAASNCLLLDLGFVRRVGLRFDEAFGATGGEDTLFTRQLCAAGGVIRWCAEARVRDHVPASRLARPWILRRQRSHAATSVRVELALAGGGAQPAIRARAAAGGLVRIVIGGLRTAGGTLIGDPRHAAKGARLLARGRGILAASTGGGVHREYDH